MGQSSVGFEMKGRSLQDQAGSSGVGNDGSGGILVQNNMFLGAVAVAVMMVVVVREMELQFMYVELVSRFRQMGGG